MTDPQPQPGKFSRYRSVRQGSLNLQAKTGSSSSRTTTTVPAPSPSEPASPTAAIVKSMSRYRRPQHTTTHLPSQSSVQTSTIHRDLIKGQSANISGERDRSRQSLQNRDRLKDAPSYSAKSASLESGGVQRSTKPTQIDGKNETARERHRQDAMDRLTGKTWETSRDAGAKPIDQGSGLLQRSIPTCVGRDTEKRIKSEISAEEPKRQSWKDGTSSLLTKAAGTIRTHNDGKKVEASPVSVAPGIDAPVSAVNAGERRVLVQYKSLSIKLPVTPSTRVQDLLYSAANVLGQNIDPKSFIIMESFSELGLERPLRRYEHVRDVMNSWILDERNSLLIVPSSGNEALARVGVDGVPSEQPKDATFFIHHSQRPGRWDKCYVTLRSDGQITVAKKKGSEDQTNICHLSDFDIYSPTPHYLSKKIKPPRRMCYAVKSQQKSSMFISTENFVHFFASNDRDTADKWYGAVQRWRSWYLVNKLGATDTGEESKLDVPQNPRTLNYERRMSAELNFYQLGTFKPLLDLESFDRRLEDRLASFQEQLEEDPTHNEKPSISKDSTSRKKPVRAHHAPPPPSFPKKLTLDTEMDAYRTGTTTLSSSQALSTDSSEAAPFAPTGLLGRTYSQRQRAMREREDRERRDMHTDGQDAFPARSLLGSIKTASSSQQPNSFSSRTSSRTNTMRSVQGFDSSGPVLSRSNSVQKQKPLVDLTLMYHEPPQYLRKGHGLTVEPSMPLVEAATGRELAHGVIENPPSKTWKRTPDAVRSVETDAAITSAWARNRFNTVHNASQGRLNGKYAAASPSSFAECTAKVLDSPFVPNSLLARSAKLGGSQGTEHTGHGVVTGNRNAAQPLLDLAPKSLCAESSRLVAR